MIGIGNNVDDVIEKTGKKKKKKEGRRANGLRKFLAVNMFRQRREIT